MTTIAVDLDGTINADPKFFRAELEGLRKHGVEVYVISANPKAVHVLAQLGFVQPRDFNGIVVVPQKGVAQAKVAAMKKLGASLLIDNRGKNCKAASRAGFFAHHVLLPNAKPKPKSKEPK